MQTAGHTLQNGQEKRSVPGRLSFKCGARCCWMWGAARGAATLAKGWDVFLEDRGSGSC